MCSAIKGNKKHTFSKDTFAESEKFGNFLVLHGLAGRSLKSYINIVRQYRKKHKIPSQDGVAKFLTEKKHMHPYYFSAIRYYIAFKELAGKGPTNIIVPKVRFKDPEPRQGIPRSVLKKIIDALPETINKDALYLSKLLYFSGLRIEECLSAIFGNLYRDEKINKNILRVTTKGGYIHHALLHDAFFLELKEYVVGKGLLHNDRLFFNQCKNVESAYRTFRWILEETGNPDIRKIMQTHNFRRGVVNEIVDKTGNIAMASVTIGHHRIGSTMKYVSKQQREKLQEEGLKAITED